MTSALAVVAHYDDAVLWIGGTIRQTMQNGWDWTVVAMCVTETWRRQYFQESCDSLQVNWASKEFLDIQSGDPFDKNCRDRMRKAVQEIFSQRKYDLVFTHSLAEHCEYGYHANHMEVAQIIREVGDGNTMSDGTSRVVYFAYKPIYPGGVATVAATDAIAYLQLEYDDLLWKCKWCERALRFDESLRCLAWPCPNPEAFSGDGLSLSKPFVLRT